MLWILVVERLNLEFRFAVRFILLSYIFAHLLVNKAILMEKRLSNLYTHLQTNQNND